MAAANVKPLPHLKLRLQFRMRSLERMCQMEGPLRFTRLAQSRRMRSRI
jgi:hypothetical protein